MTNANDPPPVPPVRPDDEDCCRSGCEHCVFELYEDALERYEAELRAWEQRQRAKRLVSHLAMRALSALRESEGDGADRDAASTDPFPGQRIAIAEREELQTVDDYLPDRGDTMLPWPITMARPRKNRPFAYSRKRPGAVLGRCAR